MSVPEQDFIDAITWGLLKSDSKTKKNNLKRLESCITDIILVFDINGLSGNRLQLVEILLESAKSSPLIKKHLTTVKASKKSNEQVLFEAMLMKECYGIRNYYERLRVIETFASQFFPENSTTVTDIVSSYTEVEFDSGDMKRIETYKDMDMSKKHLFSISHGFHDHSTGGMAKIDKFCTKLRPPMNGINGDTFGISNDWGLGNAVDTPLLTLLSMEINGVTLYDHVVDHWHKNYNTYNSPLFNLLIKIVDKIESRNGTILEEIPAMAKKVFRKIDGEDVIFVYSFDYRMNIFLNSLYNKHRIAGKYHPLGFRKSLNYVSTNDANNTSMGIKQEKVSFVSAPPLSGRDDRDIYPLHTRGALKKKYKRFTKELVMGLYEFIEKNKDWYKDYYNKRVNFHIAEILNAVEELTIAMKDSSSTWADMSECKLPDEELLWIAPESQKSNLILDSGVYNIREYVTETFIISLILNMSGNTTVNSGSNRKQLSLKLNEFHTTAINNIVWGK